MNKKGYVFVETIVVLVVVVMALSTIMMSYTLIKSKSKQIIYYNKSSDLYALYNFSKIGTDDLNNYSNDSTFIVDKSNCTSNSTINKYIANTGNSCDCKCIFETYNMESFGIIKQLDLTNTTLINTIGKDSSKNGLYEFLKTYQVKSGEAKKDYIIGIFLRNKKYYYAAIELT